MKLTTNPLNVMISVHLTFSHFGERAIFCLLKPDGTNQNGKRRNIGRSSCRTN